MFDRGWSKKNSFPLAKLEVLGINTSGKSEEELAILGLLLPSIEAYYEYINRRTDEVLTPQRAYDLVFAVTGDEQAANAAFSNVKFSSTPLKWQ